MYEIVTYGGGQILVDVFNAIVRVAGDANYLTAVKIAIVFGALIIYGQVAIGMNFSNSIKWYMSFFLIYNILLVPKASIKITDKINSNIIAATVDNVPWGLAVYSSTISQIGDSLIRMTEKNFSIPNDLKYSEHGMLFGAKLMQNVSNSTIKDINLALNLNSFLKQCLIYGVSLGRYTMDKLANNPDLWNEIEGNASTLIHVSYIDPTNRVESLLSCQEGAPLLHAATTREANNSLRRLQNKFSHDGSVGDTSNSNLIDNTYQYMLGISQNATKLLEQNMLVNAIINSTSSYAMSNNATAAAENFAQVKAELQMKMSANATAIQAEKWLPLLKVVFECLFYGIFPFIILISMLPNGFTFIRTYFMLFIWLQSWGVLYAILNRIMMGTGANWGASIVTNSANGITLSNYLALQNLSSRIATVGSYLSMSIPFLSAGIVRGVDGISSLATSMLSTPQSVSNSVATEVASGNLSYGNAALSNANYNNLSANKHDSSFYRASGIMTNVGGNGISKTTLADGTEVYDTSRLENKTLVQTDVVESMRSSIQQSMNESTSKAESYGKSYEDSINKANNMAMEAIKNDNYRFNENNTLSNEERKSVEHSMHRIMGAGISKGLIYNRTHNEDYQKVKNAVTNGSLILEDSQGTSLNNSITSSWSQAEHYAEQQRLELSKVKQYNNELSYINSNETSIRQNFDNEVIDYIRQNYTSEEAEAIIGDKDRYRQSVYDYTKIKRNNFTHPIDTINYSQGQMSNIYNGDLSNELQRGYDNDTWNIQNIHNRQTSDSSNEAQEKSKHWQPNVTNKNKLWPI